MTTSFDSAPQPFDMAPQPGDLAPPSPQPQPKRSAGHVIAIVIGCFMLLPGIGLTLGGGALAVGQAVATDDDGYFRFTLDSLESDGVAVATDDTWIEADNEDWPWVLDWIDLDVRVRATGTAATEDVFVGIARSADVERYLADANYSSVVELDHRTPVYALSSGERRNVAPPNEQDFWVASSAGTGEQTVTWAARGGRWAIVVMNADGSSDVSADVEFGARSDAVTPIAVTLLVLGGVTMLIATALIVIGVRGRRTQPTETANPFVIDDRPTTPT